MLCQMLFSETKETGNLGNGYSYNSVYGDGFRSEYFKIIKCIY